MKSAFRIYAKTSKGNDNHLLNELKAMSLNPKYDQHLNSFYFSSNFTNLFDICFKCMTVEQIYVQIGQKFRIIDEQQIKYELERLPFKNFMPIQRGLIQNTTLKVLIRQSAHLPSQNVLINLITTNFNRQIVKKQYYRSIIDSSYRTGPDQIQQNQAHRVQLVFKKERRNDESFFQIKDIVERKWFQQDEIRQENNKVKILQLQDQIKLIQSIQKQKLLFGQNQHQNDPFNIKNSPSNDLTHSEPQSSNLEIKRLQNQVYRAQNFDMEQFLSEQLVYHPHLIFYIRKNKGRFLLKINKEDLYKHGWKNAVNWGPIRQSIAASVLHQSKILKSHSDKQKCIKLWDPMCGSGTFPLVAATILDQVPIRSNVEKIFEWKHWPIYKSQYLNEYLQSKEKQKKQKIISFQLISSDKDRQTINYAIDNFKSLVLKQSQNFNQSQRGSGQSEHSNQQKQSLSQLFPSRTIKSEILQLVENKIGFACGDFEEVIKILTKKPTEYDSGSYVKLNIITNMPYLYGRSAEKHPLNQLISIYKRFSSMINEYKDSIDNVFIIIDRNITDKNHFLNVSSEKWTLVSQYLSGGMEIGLYAWNQNQIKTQFQPQSNELILYKQNELTSQERQIILKKEKSVQKALIQYRTNLSQIDRKYYNLPKHLTKDARGWQRILQRRRKRHLQSAFELFARRRDKLIALKHYAREKLELKVLKRGTVWKNKNLRFFNNNQAKLQEYSDQIKQIFEKKIEEALKREEDFKDKIKLKQGDTVQIAKSINKWNGDQKNMVRQIKKSKSSQYRQYDGRQKERRRGEGRQRQTIQTPRMVSKKK